MLYNLLVPLADQYSFLNIFQYITLRSGGAVLTSLILSFIFGPYVINQLKIRQKKGQPIRKEGPERHIIEKAGTPTMGGLLILIAVCISTLLWANLQNIYVWIVVGVTLAFGTIGFVDDYLKIKRRSSSGISGRVRLLLQTLICLGACWFVAGASPDGLEYRLAFPFFKDLLFNMGWMFFVFAPFVIVGTANAVNLTDGLDGLAIVPVMIAAACFGMITYLVGNAVFAEYLHIHYIPGSGELAIFCGALLGAGLGFLWFNAPPAMIFMGDTGSLALGSALGIMSVITKHEFVLAIIGGLFVLETISVIVQVISFKLTGKRVFRMAPLHHHFEQKGWAESTIVIRFWIIATILALVGLSTLKLR